MQCLLKYQWVKLPRTSLPSGKGVMGSFTKLMSRAAFRDGNAKYCGFTNYVKVGSWVGGIVGVKSILGVKSKQKAFEILDELAELNLIKYDLNSETKKLSYEIIDWNHKFSGKPTANGSVYATEDYGFICVPRNLTKILVDRNRIFEESDALMDLWCHTVWQDSCNAFSALAPIVQFGNYGAALTLENLGRRWKWEKTKVWRFLNKHKDAFTLYKLPGSLGSLIFNINYPCCVGTDSYSADGEKLNDNGMQDIYAITDFHAKIKRILDEIRLMGQNTFFDGNDNERINFLIFKFSAYLIAKNIPVDEEPILEGRVAVLNPIIRVYFSQCLNCKKCIYDCWNDIYKHPDLEYRKILGPSIPQKYGGETYE